MRSDHLVSIRRHALAPAALLVAAGFAAFAELRVVAQQTAAWEASVSGAATHFYADDPIWRDGDMRDIAPVAPFDLSKSYEFLNETFGETVQSRGRAINVNTLDEVP